MQDPIEDYLFQSTQAKLLLEKLLIRREDIEKELKLNEVNMQLHKELRGLNMDIKITLNEIEFVEEKIEKLRSEN